MKTINRREFLAAGAALAPGGQTTRDDWQGVARVVAVGDVHGDKDALVAVLQMAGVVNAREEWTGGRCHVVQIGDIPARGTQVRKCFDFLIRLEREAEAAGGKLHPLIGNHDAGVVYGDLRGTLPEEYGDFREADSVQKLERAFLDEMEARRRAGRLPAEKAELDYLRRSWFESHPPGFVEHRQAFSPAGEYGSWIRRNNSVIRINDTLFLHAGISPRYVRYTRQQINATIRRELADPDRLLPGMASDTQGPLWYRGFAEEEGAAGESHLKAVLRFHMVRRIVIGHTVTRTAILPRYGGRVVNIDLGLSRFYGRPPACLVFEEGGCSVLHRGTHVPLPDHQPRSLINYLRTIEAADIKPSPVTALLKKLSPAE